MTNIGIIEAFFGSVWSQESRLAVALFLKKYGGDFYIYAPKRDSFLRKCWRSEWTFEYLAKLTQLRNTFHNENLKFGVGLSPFGLGSSLSSEDVDHLAKRFKILSSLNLDYLGLFFDDMPSTEGLLATQTKVVNLALNFFPTGLIFCPSYYTYDSILDKVFGKRPMGYIEGLKDAIPTNIDICWTGPRIINSF